MKSDEIIKAEENKNMRVNINSSEFPLITLRKYPEDKSKRKSKIKKLYNELKNNNNKESPDYLKLKLLPDNPQTRASNHISNQKPYESKLNSNEFALEQLKEINELKKSPNNLNEKTYVKNFSDLNFDEKRSRLLNYKPEKIEFPDDYMSKEIVKNLEKKMINSVSYRLKPSINITKMEENSKEIIYDFHPQKSSYLKNYNDFKISEGNSNFKAVLTLPKKKTKDFNCVIDKIKDIQPDNLQIPNYSNHEKK